MPSWFGTLSLLDTYISLIFIVNFITKMTLTAQAIRNRFPHIASQHENDENLIIFWNNLSRASRRRLNLNWRRSRQEIPQIFVNRNRPRQRGLREGNRQIHNHILEDQVRLNK